MNDSDTARARLVGINHVALEVGDIEEALDFYGDVFAFELRGRTDSGAFLDMGDQFLALSRGGRPGDTDRHRHFRQWSTTPMRSRVDWQTWTSRRSPVEAWTSGTRGATGSR